MGVCKVILAVLVAAIAILFGVVPKLDDGLRYEINSRALYPVFRIGWSTGLQFKLMFAMAKAVDDKGYKHPPMLMGKEHFEKILEWTPDADDVFLVTFPKSGTHLMSQLVSQVIHNGTLTDFESIHHVVTAVEFENVNGKLCNDPKILSIFDYKEKKPGTMMAHMTHLPVQNLRVDSKAKFVVMIRAPLDTFKSMHDMICKMMGPRLCPYPEEFVKPMFQGDLVAPGGYGWAEYNLEWWKIREQDNVLVLFYEDALKDPTGTVEKVTRFLGRPVDPETVERVRHLSSVEYMKPIGAKFEPPLTCLNPPFPKPPGKVDMINKGKAGRGKSLADGIRQTIKAYFDRVLAGSELHDRYVATFN